MTPVLAQIIMFGGNFAPRGWAFCDGQLLPISQNQALFSILGTIYGGDGRTTFALPELRCRALIHVGNGPGLSSRRLGAKGGTETNTLNVLQIPAHNHTAAISGSAYPRCQDGNINATNPSDQFFDGGRTTGGAYNSTHNGKMGAVDMSGVNVTTGFCRKQSCCKQYATLGNC